MSIFFYKRHQYERKIPMPKCPGLTTEPSMKCYQQSQSPACVWPLPIYLISLFSYFLRPLPIPILVSSVQEVQEDELIQFFFYFMIRGWWGGAWCCERTWVVFESDADRERPWGALEFPRDSVRQPPTPVHTPGKERWRINSVHFPWQVTARLQIKCRMLSWALNATWIWFQTWVLEC